MATPKFYRKFYPAVLIRLSNNVNIQFAETGVHGFFSTTDQFIQDEFSRMMTQQKGGITEITAAEFQSEYVEKKTQSPISAPRWREELSKSTPGMRSPDPVERLGGEYVQRAVAVSSESDIRKNNSAKLAPAPGTTMVEPSDTAAVPEPKKEFIPTVGKRKPLKK